MVEEKQVKSNLIKSNLDILHDPYQINYFSVGSLRGMDGSKILHGRKARQITASDGNLWVSALFFAYRLPQKSGQKVNESICLGFFAALLKREISHS